MTYELRSDDTWWVSDELVYMGNNTWTNPTSGGAELEQAAYVPVNFSRVKLTYDWNGGTLTNAIAAVTNLGTFVNINASVAGSGTPVELTPPDGEYFTHFYTDFSFSGFYATICNIRDIYVEVPNVELPISRLYKLETFDSVIVEVPDTSPPQINRPPSIPGGSAGGEGAYIGGIFNTGGTSFGSSSFPSGGSGNNTNTNNRPNSGNNDFNNKPLDPINSAQDREKLLDIMHKNNVSGMQY